MPKFRSYLSHTQIYWIMAFIECESFAHLHVKEDVFKWLVEEEQGKEDGQVCSLSPFIWRKCAAGIHTELKFYSNSSYQYFEHQPKKKGRILFVPDIVIFQAGHPQIIIEVVHKNPPTQEKIEAIYFFFQPYEIELYVIYSDYILRQIKKPDHFKTVKILPINGK